MRPKRFNNVWGRDKRIPLDEMILYLEVTLRQTLNNKIIPDVGVVQRVSADGDEKKSRHGARTRSQEAAKNYSHNHLVDSRDIRKSKRLKRFVKRRNTVLFEDNFRAVFTLAVRLTDH